MDALKKEILLEACDLVSTRLDVLSAHINYRGTLDVIRSARIQSEIVEKLRGDLSFLRRNIQSEPITLKADDLAR